MSKFVIGTILSFVSALLFALGTYLIFTVIGAQDAPEAIAGIILIPLAHRLLRSAIYIRRHRTGTALGQRRQKRQGKNCKYDSRNNFGNGNALYGSGTCLRLGTLKNWRLYKFLSKRSAKRLQKINYCDTIYALFGLSE